MKLAFCTCVKLGKSCIEKVYEIGGKFDLLITLEDHLSTKKSGRIFLDDLAQKNDTPLLKINHINDEASINSLIDYEIDWLFLIGWSQIASSNVLNSCKKGVIGAHPTLLPRGRGRAAIPWTIIKGLNKTGVTFFNMDEGVDTGNILGQKEITVLKNETAATLYEKVNNSHIDLIEEVWRKIESNSLTEIIQDNQKSTYWEGRKPSDGEIFPNKMTINEIDKLVRATTKPYPGAFVLKNKSKLIIWEGKKGKALDGIKIKCIDGYYTATNYQKVSLSK
tara:strand:+ start:5098 stop:5931 length:834 start_codon:yes stop_codon:yes gene_type:complete